MTTTPPGTGPHAWLVFSALLALASATAWWWPSVALDWQPELAFSQPWRWWSAAFVHWSLQHLLANLGALTVVAAWGWVSNVSPRAVLAWVLAWPLTHAALLLQPTLLHYGGLSGVQHAGVLVVLVQLLRSGPGPRRTVAAMVSTGVAVKLLLEAPWGTPLRVEAGWDIALAPLAHAGGAAAGLVMAWLLGVGREPGQGGGGGGAEVGPPVARVSVARGAAPPQSGP